MFIQPIDVVVIFWLVLAVLCTAYVAFDQFKNNPEPAVMKWGFVLVTLYMGPVGLLLYVMADKEPKPGTHEAFIKPLWKQGVGSTVHCVAGDATGIILAAVIVSLIGLPMWLDLIVEYVAGFLFGLLIFQSLFMKSMMGGTYPENVRRSFMPEWISMNAMMAGMAPVMSFLMMSRDMRAMWPGEPLFWFTMSLGVTVGFAVAYPVNVWLVSRNMKHGLMTVRKQEGRGRQSAPHAVAGTHLTINDATPAGAGGPNTAFEGILGSGQDASPHPMATAGHGGMQHGSRGGMSEGGHDGHDGMQMKPNVTGPQLAAVTGVTLLMLLAGLYVPSVFVNLNLSAHEVGGLIMPPGMIMPRDTPAEAMQDMAAVDPRDVSYSAPGAARGDLPLEPRLENGVKVFDLETSVIRWNILPYQQMTAYAINRQVPGPRIELEQGDRVRFNVTNNLPDSTTIHWHGLILPNEMDGPAEITQEPIQQGESYVYQFTARQTGTYFYHSHDHVDRQQALGLYGALIVRPTTNPENLARLRDLAADRAEDPVTAAKTPESEPQADHEYTIQLQEWLERDGLTYPAMIMEGGLPNFFTINGKAYPATDTIGMKVGQTLKLRFIGSNNNFVHPMHVHGGPFEVVARDGEVIKPSARFLTDTVNVGPGQRYDVVWTAREAGKWLIHCHIPHHTVNNNVEEEGGGGLMMIINVTS